MMYEVGKGRPPIKTRFKKGQSGNPEGARLHNQELKQIKQLAAPDVRKLCDLILTYNVDQIETMLREKGLPALELMLASVALKAFRTGNWRALEVILSRVVGRGSKGNILQDEGLTSRREMYERMTDEELSKIIDEKIAGLLELKATLLS
jgi:hypothetical protein